jgi:hypothetical protein
VRSANQKGTIESFPSVDGVGVVPNRRFDDFTGYLGLFENNEAWKGAHLQAILESKADDIEALRHYEQRLENDLKGVFDEHYRISTLLRTIWENSDYSVAPLPIMAAIEVYVAGKPVWRAEGWLARVWEHDEDVRLLLVARFPSSPISAVPSEGHAEAFGDYVLNTYVPALDGPSPDLYAQESFNGGLRDECLNEPSFTGLQNARWTR